MRTVSISGKEFEDSMYAVNYKSNLLFKVYKADRIIVTSKADLSRTPIEYLTGDFIFQGILDLSNSSVKKINVNSYKYIYTSGSPYGRRLDRIRDKLLKRKLRNEKAFDTPMMIGFFEKLVLEDNIYDIKDYFDEEYGEDNYDHTILYAEVKSYYEYDGCIEIGIDVGDFLMGTDDDMVKFAIDRQKEIFNDGYSGNDLIELMSRNSSYFDNDKLLSDIEAYVRDWESDYRDEAYDEVERDDDMSDIEYEDLIDEYVERRISSEISEYEYNISNGDYKSISDMFGIKLENYFDFDKLAKEYVDYGGIGYSIGTYDNETHEYHYDGKWYCLVRTD